MSKPIIAIVGRPNVGKSTLFNALAGEKISIVKDTPGVTRDRIYADVTWLNYQFTLIDTGGIEPDSGDLLLSHMRGQAEIAMETADVIIFLTDVRQGLVDADYQVADMLRRSGKPIVLAVNKVDNYEKFVLDTYEFYNRLLSPKTVRLTRLSTVCPTGFMRRSLIRRARWHGRLTILHFVILSITRPMYRCIPSRFMRVRVSRSRSISFTPAVTAINIL